MREFQKVHTAPNSKIWTIGLTLTFTEQLENILIKIGPISAKNTLRISLTRTTLFSTTMWPAKIVKNAIFGQLYHHGEIRRPVRALHRLNFKFLRCSIALQRQQRTRREFLVLGTCTCGHVWSAISQRCCNARDCETSDFYITHRPLPIDIYDIPITIIEINNNWNT